MLYAISASVCWLLLVVLLSSRLLDRERSSRRWVLGAEVAYWLLLAGISGFAVYYTVLAFLP